MARRVVLTLAGVVLLRVLGVSLLLPGFVAYGERLGGSTFETGVAFGAYPLALALFMLPLGALSDRLGRRAVMAGALTISAVGGILAAFAPTVLLLGLARFVQGSGAVNAVALATAAEAGDPDARTRRMAVLGAAAGIGFAAGLLLGALLLPFLGIPGLLIAHSLATLALVPAIVRQVPPRAAAEPVLPLGPLPWRDLGWLGLGGLALNLSLTGLVFLSPLLVAKVAPDAPYGLLLAAMVLPAGLGMHVAARFADRGHARAVGVGAAVLLGAGTLPFLAATPLWLLVVGGAAYFVGHASLSSLLPSLAAAAGSGGRGGRAQGVLSTLQYVGSFFGASVAGALYPSAPGLGAVFLLAAGLLALAVIVTTPRASPTE